MRILFIDFTLPYLLKDSEFPVGGWAVQLRQLLIGLKGAGHHGGVLTWKGANAYVGEQSVCELLETYDETKGIRKLRFFYYVLPSILLAARSFKPDVIVQSCAAFNTGLMAAVASVLGIPFVHRLASDTDADGRYASYLSLRERIGFRFGVKKSQLVICQNEYQKEKIGQFFPGKRTHLIHNIILGADDLPPVSPRAARSYIAWLGVFRRQKNLPLLLQIARELPTIEFHIGGMPPPKMEPETASVIAALEALPNVRFRGYIKREGVPEFLSGAVALLSTADFEGFSNAFLESFMSGTPVVARRAVDPDGIIARNDLGRVADGEQDLAGAVRAICELDAPDYNRLSQRCRDYVETNHAPSRGLVELLGALQSIVAKPHPL